MIRSLLFCLLFTVYCLLSSGCSTLNNIAGLPVAWRSCQVFVYGGTNTITLSNSTEGGGTLMLPSKSPVPLTTTESGTNVLHLIYY